MGSLYPQTRYPVPAPCEGSTRQCQLPASESGVSRVQAWVQEPAG